MATRGDASQAAREGGRLGVSSVVEGLATGIIEIGAATPVVAPLCVASSQQLNQSPWVGHHGNTPKLFEKCVQARPVGSIEPQ